MEEDPGDENAPPLFVPSTPVLGDDEIEFTGAGTPIATPEDFNIGIEEDKPPMLDEGEEPAMLDEMNNITASDDEEGNPMNTTTTSDEEERPPAPNEAKHVSDLIRLTINRKQ